MTKKDLITELIDELIEKNLIAEKNRNLSIGIAMGVMCGFTIVANAYVLEEE